MDKQASNIWSYLIDKSKLQHIKYDLSKNLLTERLRKKTKQHENKTKETLQPSNKLLHKKPKHKKNKTKHHKTTHTHIFNNKTLKTMPISLKTLKSNYNF